MHASIHPSVQYAFCLLCFLVAVFCVAFKNMEDAKECICSVCNTSPGKPSARISSLDLRVYKAQSEVHRH